MKVQIIPLILCFAFIASTSAQLTWATTWQSKPNVYSLEAKPKGTFLTLSTTEGFAWVLPDNIYSSPALVTLVCVSDGSIVDFGAAPSAQHTFPADYSKESQILPLLGNNFPSLSSDTNSLYYPSKPSAGVSLNPTPITLGDTYLFASQIYGKIAYSKYKLGDYSLVHSTGEHATVGFEILNCGSAIWCLQTMDEYNDSPGNCNPSGSAPTCTAPVCSVVAAKTNCTDSSTLVLEEGSCVTECSAGRVALSFQNHATVCTCNNPCAECSETVNTCTSCIAGYYLSEDKCVTECPAGYTSDSPTRKCVQNSTSKVKGWKLAFIIALPIVAVLSVIGGFIYGKKLSAKKKRSEAKYMDKENVEVENFAVTSGVCTPSNETFSNVKNP